MFYTRKNKISLTLIEVMMAAVIFSLLSVSLYSFLHSGISVRKKVEGTQAFYNNILINLEILSKELRNIIMFRDQDSGLRAGSNEEGVFLEYYTLGYDYIKDLPKILNISYIFNASDGKLLRIAKDPFSEEKKEASFIENLVKVEFLYFDNEWLDQWGEDKKDYLPPAVKIKLEYLNDDNQSTILEKYVFLYR